MIAEDQSARLESFLNDTPLLDILGYRDERGFSVLALSAFKNSEASFMLFVEYARRQNVGAERMRIWADMRTDELFTAVHFAAYHGNLPITRVLVEEMGCDIFAQNLFGANVLHISAQGDSPVTLYYFVNTHMMSIDSVDERGSTPLHWACYARAEFAINFLLAMNAQLEL